MTQVSYAEEQQLAGQSDGQVTQADLETLQVQNKLLLTAINNAVSSLDTAMPHPSVTMARSTLLAALGKDC